MFKNKRFVKYNGKATRQKYLSNNRDKKTYAGARKEIKRIRQNAGVKFQQ